MNAHAFTLDRLGNVLWSWDSEDRALPDELWERMNNPNVSQVHFGTRRRVLFWVFRCYNIFTPDDWPARIARGEGLAADKAREALRELKES